VYTLTTHQHMYIATHN